MTINNLLTVLHDFTDLSYRGTNDINLYTNTKQIIYNAFCENLIDDEQRKQIEGEVKFLWINRNRAKSLSEVIEKLNNN